jgi:hypothetical protein
MPQPRPNFLIELKTTVKSIQPKSTERLEQVGIINEVPTDQTNQAMHLKGLFVTPNRTTTTYVPKQIQKPLGFYKKPCKRCRSMRTTKFGKVINVYQRCDSCEELLGIPSTIVMERIAKVCNQINLSLFFSLRSLVIPLHNALRLPPCC